MEEDKIMRQMKCNMNSVRAFTTPEDTKKKTKRYNELHKEQRAERKKQYYEIHKEKIKEQQKQYNELHKEQIAERTKTIL